jgi:hypothetical protein
MLTEWWTYRPHDFLMFSPRIYWRLFASINEAGWPLGLLLAGAAALWVALLAWIWSGKHPSGAGATLTRPPFARAQQVSRPMAPLALVLLPLTLLATSWAFVALAFLWQRYTPIFWAVESAAWAFALQALGWLLLAGRLLSGPMPGRGAQGGSGPLTTDPWRRLVGGLLAAAAVLLVPLAAPLAGRPWQQAELFGLAPDPTVIFSLGVLVLLPAPSGSDPGSRRLLAALWLVPLAWCVFSSTMLALMGTWQALLPLATAGLALTACARRERRAAESGVNPPPA